MKNNRNTNKEKRQGINRRDFIAKTALAGAAVTFGLHAFGRLGGINNHLHSPVASSEKRKLGKLEVSALGLGCLPMVGFYGG